MNSHADRRQSGRLAGGYVWQGQECSSEQCWYGWRIDAIKGWPVGPPVDRIGIRFGVRRRAEWEPEKSDPAGEHLADQHMMGDHRSWRHNRHRGSERGTPNNSSRTECRQRRCQDNCRTWDRFRNVQAGSFHMLRHNSAHKALPQYREEEQRSRRWPQQA